MSCLFGDATDSELELDYILLIRDLFDFAVDVLRADERIDEVEQALRASSKVAGREKARLEALYGRLAEALDPEVDTEGAAARCADAIGRACRSAIDDEVARLDREVGRERDLAERSRKGQRVACARALERLLLSPHELPGVDSELELALSGDTYGATLRGRAEYGLETVLDLEIPATSVYGGPPVRVAQLVPNVDFHLPEQRGWINKKVKQIKHKVAKHYVARVVLGSSQVTISLRAEPSVTSEGFDLVMDAGWDAPRVLTVAAGGEVAPLMEAHDLDPDDAEAVQALLGAAVDAAEDVRAKPVRLVEATLDGVRIEDHEDPTELVDRLFEVMGPTVREIAEHSPQADELVLKRSLGGDRREEIYVSRAELLGKLEVLSPDQRARFAPLGFGAPNIPPAVPASAAPRVPAPPRIPKAPLSPRTRPAASSAPPPVPSPPSPSPRAESEPARG